MKRLTRIIVSAAVEGPTDEAVLRRLIGEAGAQPGAVYGKKGKHHLLNRLAGYNNAARLRPWAVLVDLDQDADCAPPAKAKWLSSPAKLMCFSIAVRQVEAWLLADAKGLAEFLSVSASRIPANPEALANPKGEMIRLARRSRRRAIRIDMVPREGSGRIEGPAYASRLIEFACAHWRPKVAAGRADSLRRCLHRLERLTGRSGRCQSGR